MNPEGSSSLPRIELESLDAILLGISSFLDVFLTCLDILSSRDFNCGDWHYNAMEGKDEQVLHQMPPQWVEYDCNLNN